MYQIRGAVHAGSQAPEFKARDVMGRELNLADYHGRNNLVIFFYRNSRCTTCREELKDLVDKYDYIVQQDGEVIAISTDGIDETKNLAVELHLPFRVISDPDGGIIKAYGVWDENTDTAYPVIFLVDKNDVVRHRKLIPSPDDLLPADEIVNKLRDMGTPQGQVPFQSFRFR